MNTPHNVQVGTLFEMSWGYDQTNVNFFQVVEVTPAGVKVREIGSESVPNTQGMMCENVRAKKDSFLARSSWCGEGNQPTFRKVQFSNWGGDKPQPYFNFRGRYFARLTTESETHYNSWYH